MNVVTERSTMIVYVINSGIANGDKAILGYIVLNSNNGHVTKVSKEDRAKIKLRESNSQIVYLPPFTCTRVHEKTLNNRVEASRKLHKALNYFSIKGMDPSAMYTITNISPDEALGLYCGYASFAKSTAERKKQLDSLITACSSYLGLNLMNVMDELRITYSWLNRR